MTITLFVYGTLKSGRWTAAREADGEQAAGLAEGRHCRRQGAAFHDRFCRNAVDIRPATIAGRLYQLPAGFPAVVIPEESILANGTADPLADARTQAEFAERGVAMSEAEVDWGVVHGELMAFRAPEGDLPPIDRLEGFRPDGHGLYCRALVTVRAGTGVETAWVYHTTRVGRGRRLRGGMWPESPRSAGDIVRGCRPEADRCLPK
jgi:gamma-glutamylcyclotransferase (GGCT)/AIG2-like uncharacterized protein YtfP